MTLGSVGNDDSGTWILQKLEEEKLNAYILKLENRTTGSCPVTVVEADRTCIGILEACEHYDGSHLENILANQQLMSNVKYLYTTEFFLDIHQDIALHLANHAIANNRALCFNLASDEDLKNYESKQEMLFNYIEHCSFIFCNKQEAIMFTKLYFKRLNLPEDETDLIQIALAVTKYKR